MLYRIKYRSKHTGHEWQSGVTFPKKDAERYGKDAVESAKKEGVHICYWIEPEPQNAEEQHGR